MFADEFNSSTVTLGDQEESSPQYVLSPLGAMVNRLYFVGVLTEKENRGSEDDPILRARVVDPTGTFFISAGQYQPEALSSLQSAQVPSIVAVVGKSRTYSPDSESVFTSVRPEMIVEVDREVLMNWQLSACQDTLDRIEAVKEGRRMDSPSEQELQSLGFRHGLARGVPRALEHYPDWDFERMVDLVVDVLKGLREGRVASPRSRQGSPQGEMISDHPSSDQASPDTSITADDEASVDPAVEEGGGEGATGPVPSQGDGADGATATPEDHEEALLQILSTMEQTARGVPYQKLLEEAESKGISKNVVEETVNMLIDKGVVYEPTLGYLKVV